MTPPALTLPLSALLAQALIAMEHEYVRRGADASSRPSLAVWSNVLRPVGDGIELRALPAAARLSKRAVRSAVGAAEKSGWVLTEGRTVRLSPAALAVREQWPPMEASVDTLFGELGAPLCELVRQLYLEWPHFPTGYGPADHSITGGVYSLGGGRTDSTVPTHADDWAPVARHDVDGSSVEGVPISALLSQAFVAFAADFEELWIGGLHLAATVLRLLPDQGLPVTEVPMLSRLKGDGKSVLERHGFIQITRTPDDPKVRLAVPTARGRYTRDEYDPTVGRVEERWRQKYGDDVVDSLRSALESLDVDRSLPHSVIDTLT